MAQARSLIAIIEDISFNLGIDSTQILIPRQKLIINLGMEHTLFEWIHFVVDDFCPL